MARRPISARSLSSHLIVRISPSSPYSLIVGALFFCDLKDALPLGNGLYMNGDFDQMKQYLLSGAPTQGLVRFFMGYAGWQKGQLRQEIESNTWIINNDSHVDLLHMYLRDLWKESLCEMGGKYAIWSRYPKYPIMN